MLKKVITERDAQGKILKYKSLVDDKEVPEGHIYCKSCNTIHPMELFSSDKKGKYGKTATCKPCASKRTRDLYLKRRQDPEWYEQYRLKINKKNQERKLFAIDYMGGRCQDCGGTFHPSVYDLHHLDPSTKEGNPSHFMNKSDERLKEELKKCILLCANCHRIRHFKEDN